ncbi:hypothetical protein BDV95DRAFT_458523, partial [Massariosphaeria phaeospora]
DGNVAADHEYDEDATSETSTLAYSQEPYATFQDKASELSHQLFPYSADIKLDRMKGGSSNRVIGITTSGRKMKKYSCDWFRTQFKDMISLKHDEPEKYVLRIPRWESVSMEAVIATLKVIGDRAQIPTPRVIAYSLSEGNVLGKPYMLQPRLPGLSLNTVYDSLNLEQKKCVARQITKLIPDIATITSGSAGTISASNLANNGSSDIEVSRFPICDPMDDPSFTPSIAETPLEFMLGQCERWREYEEASGMAWHNIWDAFSEISESLQKYGFLEDSGFCLAHGDLLDYNLLVEIRGSTSVEITAVLDWDCAAFVPSFVAYRAPFWQWINDNEPDYDETLANKVPETDAQMACKAVFEEMASEKFKRFAFAPEAVFARRMFKILKDGIFSDQILDETKKIIRGWDELHPEDDI